MLDQVSKFGCPTSKTFLIFFLTSHLVQNFAIWNSQLGFKKRPLVLEVGQVIGIKPRPERFDVGPPGGGLVPSRELLLFQALLLPHSCSSAEHDSAVWPTFATLVSGLKKMRSVILASVPIVALFWGNGHNSQRLPEGSLEC